MMLKKSLDKKYLSSNQLTTVVAQVEAVLNSRPLVYVGDDEGEVLAPPHF